MRIKRILILLCLPLLCSSGLALASDITDADYYGVVIVSNNSTAASEVSTVMTLSTQDLIDQGWVDTAMTQIAMRNSAGADIPFMPSVNATYPWCLWVPSINDYTNLNYTLYTGNASLDSNKYYFPDSGGMTIGDDNTVELSDNGTIRLSGYFDTSASMVGETLFSKWQAGHGGIGSQVSAADNISCTIYSSANATSISDPATYWTSDDLARDGNFGTAATHAALADATWTEYLVADYGAGAYSENVSIVANVGGATTEQIDIDAYYSGGFHDVYQGAFDDSAWVYFDIGSLQLVTKVRVRLYNASGAPQTANINEYGGLYSDDRITNTIPVSGSDHELIAQIQKPFFSFGADAASTGDITPPATGIVLNAPLWQTELNASPFTTIDSNAYSFAVTTPVWSSMGYVFDGNDYLKHTAANWRNTDQIGTIIVWFKTSSATSQAFITSADEASTSEYLRFVISDTGKLSLGQATGGSSFGVTGHSVLNDGNWHMAEVSSSGTAWSMSADLTAQTLTVGTANNGNWFSDTVNRDNLVIGALIRTSTIWYMNGTIGEVAYYNRVLSAAEKTQYYEATKLKYLGTGDIATRSTLASVPNNDSDWTIGGNATPYIEYFKLYKAGALNCHIEWEYDTTFHDLSLNGNDATPSFRTASSDPDVSARLFSFRPITLAIAPAYAVTGAPDFISANITMGGGFSSDNVSPGGPPGTGLIEDVSESGGTPPIILYGVFGGLAVAMSGLFVTFMERKSGAGGGTLLLRILIQSVIIGLFVTFAKFDWWMIIMFLFLAAGVAVASRHIELGGNVSQFNLIGFLAMSWVGLTMINRIMEGQFITASETAYLNTVMFTQQFKLFGLFNTPVLNTQFFTEGIPSLVQWDYSFFGGQAQIIQYMLYSITAVVSFIIFTIIIGLLYNFLNRIR